MNNVLRKIKNAFIDFLIQRRLLRGIIRSKNLDKGIKDVTNSSYEVIKFAFDQIEITSNDVIVDVGCGKGRVFNYLLYSGKRNKMIGVEYVHEVANGTARHLKRFDNVEVRAGDIFDNYPYEGTVFYMFNPFDEQLTKKFAMEILKCDKKDKVRMFYFLPVNGSVFTENPNFQCIPLSVGDSKTPNALLIKIKTD